MTEHQKRNLRWRTITCITDFGSFRKGGRYVLEYRGNDTYTGKSGNIAGKRFHLTDTDLESYFDTNARLTRVDTLLSEWIGKARDGQPMEDETEQMYRDRMGHLAKEALRTMIEGSGDRRVDESGTMTDDLPREIVFLPA